MIYKEDMVTIFGKRKFDKDESPLIHEGEGDGEDETNMNGNGATKNVDEAKVTDPKVETPKKVVDQKIEGDLKQEDRPESEPKDDA